MVEEASQKTGRDVQGDSGQQAEKAALVFESTQAETPSWTGCGQRLRGASAPTLVLNRVALAAESAGTALLHLLQFNLTLSLNPIFRSQHNSGKGRYMNGPLILLLILDSPGVIRALSWEIYGLASA